MKAENANELKAILPALVLFILRWTQVLKMAGISYFVEANNDRLDGWKWLNSVWFPFRINAPHHTENETFNKYHSYAIKLIVSIHYYQTLFANGFSYAIILADLNQLGQKSREAKIFSLVEAGMRIQPLLNVSSFSAHSGISLPQNSLKLIPS